MSSIDFMFVGCVICVVVALSNTQNPLPSCVPEEDTDCCLCDDPSSSTPEPTNGMSPTPESTSGTSPTPECLSTCPDELLVLDTTTQYYTCPKQSTTTSQVTTVATTTTITTTTEMTTERSDAVNVTNRVNNVVDDEGEITFVKVTVCVKSCPDGMYGSVDRICKKCDPLCRTCNDSGVDNCLICELEQDSKCVQRCGNGYDRNNNICVKQKLPPKKELNIAIIIGPVACGVLLAVIVTIVVCCRRKCCGSSSDAGDRRPISTLVKNKQDSLPKEEAEVGGRGGGTTMGNKHPVYENQQRPPGLGTDIVGHGENVLRYTRDPTLPRGTKPPGDDPPSHDSTYENAAMIKLASRVKDSSKISKEELEKAELEDLGMAPAPPQNGDQVKPHTKPKNLGTRAKNRISKTFNKLSMKSSKKKGEEQGLYIPMDTPPAVKPKPMPKPAKPLPPEEPQGVYEPMGQTEDAQQELYTPMDGSQELYGNEEIGAEKRDGDEMEDYENTLKKRMKPGKNGQSEKLLEDYENAPEKVAKVVSKHGANSKDDLEDYENMPKDLKKTEDVGNEDLSDLDDYENVGAVREQLQREKHEQDAEDYENAPEKLKKK